MKRRDFLKGAAVLTAAAGTRKLLNAADTLTAEKPGAGEGPIVSEDGKLIISAPMLQNYAETSLGVAFAVSSLANGYVLLSESEDMAGARKIMCGGYRLTEISDRVIQVRLTGLKPATKYYYRIGADRILYDGGYKMKIIGNEEDPRVYSFTTAGEDAKAHFCVINDTHVRWASIIMCQDKIAEIKPSCVVWNGDASNSEETIEAQMRIFLTPEMDRKDYAAEIPYLFCPGNHDDRGFANRHLERVWMWRQPEERSSRDWDLGRNFAVRMGDIAMIGLDTAEDKLDTNPRFAGLYNSAPYREAQTTWLAEALAQKEIASAPFLVAFCHIPLYDPYPDHNPGDIAPADSDPRYTTDYAYWQRTCANMWLPLLQKAGCQLLITAHQHKYQYFPAENGRSWDEIIGGGPDLGFKGKGANRKEAPDRYPTVIEGFTEDGTMKIRIHNILTGRVQDEFTYFPRKTRKKKVSRK